MSVYQHLDRKSLLHGQKGRGGGLKFFIITIYTKLVPSEIGVICRGGKGPRGV
jgi:hypothetical protein